MNPLPLCCRGVFYGQTSEPLVDKSSYLFLRGPYTIRAQQCNSLAGVFACASMKAKYLFVLCAVMVAGFAIMSPGRALADGGDVSLHATVQFTAPNNLLGAQVAFSCPGGTFTALSTTTDSNGIASTSAATMPAGADCSNGEGIDIRVSENGYLTKTLASTTSSYTYSTSAANSYDVTNIQFGLAVVVKNEAGASFPVITPSVATFRGNPPTAVAGALQLWADTSGVPGVLDIEAPGYLWATSTNPGLGNVTTDSAALNQVYITLSGAGATCSAITFSTNSCRGLESTIKVLSMLDDLGNNVMPTSGSPFSGDSNLIISNQIYQSGAWYVAASSTGSGGSFFASSTMPGYVTRGVSNVTTSSTTQITIDYGGSNGATYELNSIFHALKVTVTSGDGSGAVSGATVTAGNTPISCVNGLVAGTYYCAVPLADRGTTATVSKSGYTTGTVSFSARSADNSPQNSVSLTLNLPVSGHTGGGGSSGSSSGRSHGGGGGGGGGGSSAPTTNASSTPRCPAGYKQIGLYICVLAAPAGTTNSTSTAPLVSTGSASAVFASNLYIGTSSDDVRRLQTLLASDPSIYPNGRITGYFGQATLKAVQTFQMKYGVASSTSVGYGNVGPATRAMLQKVYGK